MTVQELQYVKLNDGSESEINFKNNQTMTTDFMTALLFAIRVSSFYSSFTIYFWACCIFPFTVLFGFNLWFSHLSIWFHIWRQILFFEYFGSTNFSYQVHIFFLILSTGLNRKRCWDRSNKVFTWQQQYAWQIRSQHQSNILHHCSDWHSW